MTSVVADTGGSRPTYRALAIGQRPLPWSGWRGKNCGLAESDGTTKTSHQLVVTQVFTIVTTGGRRALYYVEVDY
jgi:hypothetical protein